MLLMVNLSYLLFVQLSFAFSSGPSLAAQDSLCQNATEAGEKPSCWAALGYDDWFDRWKSTCPRSPSCVCNVSKPWSECVLYEYKTAIGRSNETLSCLDLARPDACHVSHSDWAKLTENQMEVAYLSIAVKNLYDFVYGWYSFITSTPTPPVILNMLSDQIITSTRPREDQTKINIASFFSGLMTHGHTNDTVLQNFKNIISKVIGDNKNIDVALMNIMSFQNTLGQTLNQTLNVILSDWDNPYFSNLAQDGALLGQSQFDTHALLNQPHNYRLLPQPFNSANSTILTTNTRTLLSTTDATQIWDYQILSCDVSEPNGLATQLTTLLDTFHQNLFEVMLATSRGTRSRLGFPQLFKTNQWLPIRRLYENMHNGVGTAGNLASISVLPDNRPTLICLQPHKRETRAAYTICEAQPRLRAFQQPGTPYAIGLCPAFWALPKGPVRAFCPWKGEVSADFLGDALLLNQQSVLVLMLVRIYLGAQILEPEIIGLKEVLALGREEAYWNPSTWAYWFASAIGCSPSSWQDPDL